MSSSREPTVLRGDAAKFATPFYSEVPDRRAGDRRMGGRRLADTSQVEIAVGERAPFRLHDVYADELARLREEAHAEGFAAGHTEGSAAAETVVAEVREAAEQRLAEAQARWERRMATAAAALDAAAARLDAAAVPVAEEVRDSILGAVVTLVEDLLGRELEMTTSPGWDAVRRALSLCPEDAPVVVRLHPDDLAEVPAAALAGLPAGVTVLGDARIERAGAVAETGSRRVDAQLGAALERVQAVLST